MITFFDTETTGVPRDYKAPASDLENWPRVVQVGWICCLNDGTLLEEQQHTIKPIKFKIPKEASDVHGITQEIAKATGEALKPVLTSLAWRIFFSDRVVGHNIEFDDRVITAEFIRIGVHSRLDSRLTICTMKASTNFCKLPGNYPGKYKWPKLEELYFKLFDEPMGEAHTALMDIKNTAKCYFKLVELGLIK